MTTDTIASPQASWLTRIAFLALVIGGGLTIGALTAPGDWYAALNKPSFNPPGWVFGPVWTVLYLLIAMVGWRAYAAGPTRSRMRLWWVQMGLNFLWSPVFFVLHRPDWAVFVIAALLLTLFALLRLSWHADRLSAWALVPYVAWVSFASLLNISIVLLNP